jgi:hypothetical protein
MEKESNYYMIDKNLAIKLAGAIIGLVLTLGAYYFNNMINQLTKINDNISNIEKDVNEIKQSIAVMDERQKTMLFRVDGLENRERFHINGYKEDKRQSGLIFPKIPKYILKPNEIKPKPIHA